MRMLKAADFALKREIDYGTEQQNEAVKAILDRVRQGGDEALRALTRELDKAEVRDFRLTREEIAEGAAKADPAFRRALREAAANIRAFHEKQRRNSWVDVAPDGTMTGQLIRPLKRVGVYVPGGKAAYPSTVLMNVIPAQVAGVPEIVMVTPPSTGGASGIAPNILAAAEEVGVAEVYRVGGAQAVAALAFGTESIAPVDKIVGPGNIYVALAKRYVYGVVDIDSIAGPSEIAVLADDSADPAFAAADLLSQAEHDEMASSLLITASRRLADAVAAEVERQLADLPRRDIAAKSIASRGAILLADSPDEAIAAVNRIAPEHLELMVEDPHGLLGRIENAGAIFLGAYSSEPIGDYFAGPNHVLPTNGTARFSSPLNVDDFLKKSSLIQYSRDALLAHGGSIMALARSEGLEAHARAVEIRMKREER